MVRRTFRLVPLAALVNLGILHEDKMEFREALQFLADRAQIELTPYKRADNAPPQAHSAYSYAAALAP